MKTFMVKIGNKTILMRSKSERGIKRKIGKTALSLGATYREVK